MSACKAAIAERRPPVRRVGQVPCGQAEDGARNACPLAGRRERQGTLVPNSVQGLEVLFQIGRLMGRMVAIAAGAGLALLVVQGGLGLGGPSSRDPEVQHARAAARALVAWYYLPDDGLLASYAPSVSSPPAAIWGYSWGLRAVEDIASLPGSTSYLPLVRRLADDLDRYWDERAKVPGYAPTVDPGAWAIKYFDDNAWAGLDLVQAYDLTADARYLREAKEVFAYIETGWDQSRGGIYWNEDRVTRNTASNGPAAQLAARLYMATGRRAYLAWAQRIYHWQVRHLVDRRTGQVWGNLDDQANISMSAWSYNQGTVIGAATLLYRITHEPAYLAQARQTEGFVLRNLVRSDGTIVPPAEFAGVLADNLRLLYDETQDLAIARVIDQSARSAWTQARNGDGLFATDWRGPPPETQGLPLLTQSGAVRLLAVRAAIKAPSAGWWVVEGPRHHPGSAT